MTSFLPHQAKGIPPTMVYRFIHPRLFDPRNMMPRQPCLHRKGIQPTIPRGLCRAQRVTMTTYGGNVKKQDNTGSRHLPTSPRMSTSRGLQKRQLAALQTPKDGSLNHQWTKPKRVSTTLLLETPPRQRGKPLNLSCRPQGHYVEVGVRWSRRSC